MAEKSEYKERGDRLRMQTIRVVLIALIVFLGIYLITRYVGIAPTNTWDEIALSAIIGVLGIEVLGYVLYLYLRLSIREEEVATLRNLFRVIGYAILAIFELSLFSINITGLLLSAGFLGIVVGLAAQSTLSNFVAGIYLLSSKTFEPGDRVTLHTWQYTMQPQSYPHDKFVPGFFGKIKNIGLLSTELTNDDGVPVYMPNSVVAGALVLNYGRAKENVVTLLFDMSIKLPFDRAKKRIEEVLKARKIKNYSIIMEYLHDTVYVVTVHMECEFQDRRELRSEIYQRIVKDIQEAEKGHRRK